MTYDDDRRPKPSHSRGGDDGVLGRLRALTDAVFAIAITILIIGVVVPEGTTNFNLDSVLASLWPNYQGFLISFFVIGLYWISHVRQFRYIRKYGSGLLWLNLLFLLFIVIIPFTTNLVTKYGNKTTVIMYAANISCAGYMSTILWLYAVRSYQLAGKRLGSMFIRRGYIINLIAPIIFTLSIGVAFINDDLATYIWIGTLVCYIVALIVFKMPRLDDND
jgi:uncharacterized membrane protein